MGDYSIKTENILDDISLDEMQKNISYKIGHSLFKAMIFAVLGLSVVALFINQALGITLMLFGFLFYCLYAILVSAKGIMNPKFAKTASKMWYLICGIIMVIMWALMLLTQSCDIYIGICWFIISLQFIVFHFCAKRNFKVLQRQLEDNSEE